MARILFAWELGAGYGHLGGFLPMALELRERGHEVVFALRDLSKFETFLGRHAFVPLQAPVWLPEAPTFAPAVSYSEMLFRFGFLDLDGLTTMLKAWRELLRLVRPDLTIVDHGPTALLATRWLKLRRAVFGTGFASPPRLRPMPSFCSWADVAPQRLVDSEQRVLEVVNQTLARLGGAPLDAIADLFDVDEDFLCTFPELDPYPQRAGARYWGPVWTRDHGTTADWPVGRGPKIFVYLLPTYGNVEKVLARLAELPCRSLVHVPRLSMAASRRSFSSNVTFCDTPVRMESVLAECDLMLCHAGHGTVAQALLAGRPLMLIPFQTEQLLTARRVVNECKAGTMVHPDSKSPNYRQLIRDALDGAYAHEAQAFARKYSDFNSHEQMEAIATRCEELLDSQRLSRSSRLAGAGGHKS
jgi:UDP:flavonoid glycosyltransferase YjiC (YdhE family)